MLARGQAIAGDVGHQSVRSAGGVHMTYISGLGRGLGNPSLNNIRSITKAMDVNTAELFSFESECSFW